MRKLMIHYNQEFLTTNLPDTTVNIGNLESYDAFHAAVGTVLGSLAGDVGGIEGIIIRLSDHDLFTFNVGSWGLASANFSIADSDNEGVRVFLAEVTLFAE